MGKKKNNKKSNRNKKTSKQLTKNNVTPTSSKIKISILSVSQLKRIPFLKNLSRMISNQTTLDIHEWVIVNGCTSDEDHDTFNEQIKEITCGNIKMVYPADKHLQYRNIGAFRNLGNRTVTGDIIICMDDDDFYFPTYIETVVNAFENDNSIELTGCSGMLLYDFGLDTVFRLKEFGPNHTVNCCMAYRKRYIAFNKYDETCRVGEERSFLRNYASKMYQLPAMSALVHMSYGDNTFNGKRINMFKNMVAGILRDDMDTLYQAINTNLNKLIKNEEVYKNYMELFNTINDQVETDIIFYYGVLESEWNPHDKNLKSYQRRCLELGREFIKKGYSVSVYGQFKEMKDEIDGIHFYNIVSWNVRKKCKYLILMDFTGFVPLYDNEKIFSKINAEKVYIDIHTDMGAFFPLITDKNKDKFTFVLKNPFHILFSHPSTLKMDKDNYKSIIVPGGIDLELFQKDYGVKREFKRFCYTSKYNNGLQSILTTAWPIIIKNHPDAEFHCYHDINLLHKSQIETFKELFKQKNVYDHGYVNHEEIAIEMQKSSFLYYFTAGSGDADNLSVREALASGCIPIIWNKNNFANMNGLVVPDTPNQSESHVKLANRISKILVEDKERERVSEQFKTSSTIITTSQAADVYILAFNDDPSIMSGTLVKKQYEEEIKKHQEKLQTSKQNFDLPSNIDLSKYVDSDSDSDSESDVEYESDSDDEESYIPSENFTGPKEGFVFKTDKKGSGYYKDKTSTSN